MLFAFFLFTLLLKPNISFLVCVLLLQKKGCSSLVKLGHTWNMYVGKETGQVRERKEDDKRGYCLLIDELLIKSLCISDICHSHFVLKVTVLDCPIFIDNLQISWKKLQISVIWLSIFDRRWLKVITIGHLTISATSATLPCR